MRRIPKHRPPPAHLFGPRCAAPSAGRATEAGSAVTHRPMGGAASALASLRSYALSWRTWPGRLRSRGGFPSSRRHAS